MGYKLIFQFILLGLVNKEQRQGMLDFVFNIFYLLMVAAVIIFLVVNLPIPKIWKTSIFKIISNSNFFKTVLKIQVLLVVIAILFYVDLQNNETQFQKLKNKIKDETTLGAELKRGTLSYQILQIQKNKYILFLFVFSLVVTAVFFWIKQKRYHMQELHKVQIQKFEEKHPSGRSSQFGS